MDALRVAVIQTELVWQDWEANKAQLTPKLAEQQGLADVIVLPEMFASGFSMDTSMAQRMDGDAVAWMREQAEALDAVVCGSLMMDVPGEGCVNRFIWMPPAGAYQTYDKRHLFRMGNEHEHYQPGDQRVVIEYRGWRILPLVCYDLRFPVFARNRQDYDLFLIVANWPARRSHHWKTLIAARAIENQAYVVACNRVGTDGNDWAFSGGSQIIDPQGAILAQVEDDQAGSCRAELSLSAVNEYREAFPAWQDADAFELS
ncbi:amidohydrolase [Pokkaliibacter sp. CJK22405]|uniref:amidohydrolase n=1 Tax=Pokkaliibacter sp. CJK22405 TaxID=3384615 RepID=UPI003985618B